MKKHSFKLRTIVAAFALSGLMITTTIPTFANDKKTGVVANESIQPSVKYLSSDENGSTFLVQLEAVAPVKFELTIKEKSGETLYSQAFEAASFLKTFKLLNDNNGRLELSFTIKSLPDGALNTFNVSSTEKLVSQVSVKKS